MLVDNPLSTIMVGFGRIAQRFANDKIMARWIPFATHAQVLRAHPGFEWSAVIDADERARTEAQIQWGIKEVVEDADQLVDVSQFEVLVLATPPNAYSHFLDVFPNLKAIIIEKPIGLNLNLAGAFLDRCESKNISVQVNFPRRADSIMRSLAGSMLSDIGEVQAAFSVYGNGLINNGTHVIDWGRMFLGEVSWIKAIPEGPIVRESPFSGDFSIPFVIGFDSGFCLTAHPLTFTHYRENSLDIWGSLGRLSFYQEGLIVSSSSSDDHRFLDSAREIPFDRAKFSFTDQGRAMYDLYDNLHNAVSRGAALWSSGRSAYRAMEIVEAIRSSYSRGGVTLEI